jgi:branched-chain amino acid transport system substrate-binding protein
MCPLARYKLPPTTTRRKRRDTLLDLTEEITMRKRCLPLILFCALLAVLLVACNRVPETIKIGVGQPLSGGSMREGQDLLNGALLAVEEINAAGGVRLGSDRVRLELVAQDDKSNAEGGVAAAKALVDADVTVAIGHLSSGISIAAAPIYAKAGIPQLAISTKASYTQLNLPTTLRLVANDDLQAQAMASYAASLAGAQKFAVVDDASVYGRGLGDAAAAGLASRGKSVLLRQSLDRTTVEFAPTVAEIGKSAVDVVVTVLNDFQVRALIEQLAKAGLTDVRILGGDGIKTDQLYPVARMVRAIYATSPILEPQEFPTTGAAFLAKFRARFKSEPVYAAHYTYDAVYLVADAIARNGKTDKGALLDRLKSFDGIAPVTGQMRFGANGEQRYGRIAVYELRPDQWARLVSSDRW